MPNLSRYILFSGLCICIISIVYFLCLTASLPLAVTVIVTLASVAAIGWWLFNGPSAIIERNDWWALGALAIGLYLIVSKANTLAEPYGAWDAWSIWNLHANYLADAAHWKTMFLNRQFSHPDYPLAQPAFIAFFNRMLGNNVLMPYILSFFLLISIPVFIFSEMLKKNMVVAIAAIFFIAQDMSFITKGTYQCADTLLAFFFLLAIACIYCMQENRKYVTLSAFFIAGCVWVKNEGMVLAAIFILFNVNTFFSPKNIKYFLAGTLLPLATVIFFKVGYTHGNDMIDKQANTMAKLKDGARYFMVWDFFKRNLNANYYYIKIGVFLYGLVCVLQKKSPDRQMLMLLTCLLVYMGIYIITPNDLEWHLNTSQDRLMHQLMPAFILVMAKRFSDIRVSLSEQ